MIFRKYLTPVLRAVGIVLLPQLNSFISEQFIRVDLKHSSISSPCLLS